MLKLTQSLNYHNFLSYIKVNKRINFYKWQTLLTCENKTKHLKTAKAKKRFTIENNNMNNVIFNVKSQNTIHGDFKTFQH